MRKYAIILPGLFLLLLSCSTDDSQGTKLTLVAESDRLWTGIAVSQDNRIYVNYPRWSPGENISVAEVIANNQIRPYPDMPWNSWNSGKTAKNHFVCVQSVVADRNNNLWILDTGVDVTSGIITGGAKLVKVDLSDNTVLRTYFFDSAITPPGTYLNDVRIDSDTRYAYITDSGRGAIIVLDLHSGHSRRLLGSHHSTKSENIQLVIEGKPWLDRFGKTPQIHSDGIALHPDEDFLYFQALSGKSLYKIETKILTDFAITEIDVGAKVQLVEKTGAADGLIFDRDGNLYISAIEDNTIKRYTASGALEVVVRDSLLKWPDSFSISAKNELYITTSQIHLGPARVDPFRIFKIQL